MAVFGRWPFVAVFTLVLTGCGPSAPPAAVLALPPAAADHHMHIQGPAATDAIWRIFARQPLVVFEVGLGVAFERTPADAIARLDEAKIPRGVLLSEAYLISSPFVGTPHADVARLTRQENTYNVLAALASKGRLVAFVGVNPLDDSAMGELRHWVGREGVAGVKIHLANSGFSPQSPAHVKRLSAFLDECRKLRIPIVIHVKSGPDYGPGDARIFIRDILPHVGDTPIQIAHLGGWGGLDHSTLDVLRLYADAIEKGAPGTRRLFFDLSCILCTWSSPDPDLAKELVAVMRKIGLSRFVMGSDWPAMSSIADENHRLEAALPLTAGEWKRILANVAPYLQSAPRHAAER